MRITINLASKPFIELRPLYTRLRLWMAVLFLVAIPLWMLLKTETRKAALANARLQSVESSIRRLENQQKSYQVMMQQPQNAAVLTQAAFLNQLFARKAFSWTAIMMDLETVLPGGVQVMNIDPVTDKNGNVTVRLRISGQRDHAVELVRNLEHSHRFLQPRLASESMETNSAGQPNFQPANANGNVSFDVLADYNPLEPRDFSAKHSSDGESSSKTEDTGNKSAAPKPKNPDTQKHAAPVRPAAPARPAPAPRQAGPANVPANRPPMRPNGGVQ
jgi:type IV pilus assembly protein PilN